jgi:very-short-patch-repair endonuclease
MNIEESLP